MSEHTIQAAFVTAARLRGWLVAAIPNGAYLRGAARAAKKLIDEGMLPGMPDLVCIKAGAVVFIEMKTAKGRATATQKNLHDAIRRNGIPVHVCHSASEAFQCLLSYENGNAKP